MCKSMQYHIHHHITLAQAVELPSVLPAAKRVIAIGDLHGDLDKAKASFKIGGLINDDDQWIGGKTVVVQVCWSSVLEAS